MITNSYFQKMKNMLNNDAFTVGVAILALTLAGFADEPHQTGTAPMTTKSAAAPAGVVPAPGDQVGIAPVRQWAVLGPSWGRSGLSCLSNGLETRVRPTPGDVSFSWGTDRRRCLVWQACEVADGVLDFYTDAVLPGVEKMAISDDASRWAGSAAIAHTYIHSDAAQSVLLSPTSRQPTSMWLNGAPVQPVHGKPANVRLAAGWNRLLVKVLSPSAIRDVEPVLPSDGRPSNWTLQLDITAPDGSAPNGLTMQAEDPERVPVTVGEAGLPLRVLTRLTGPGSRRPLFVRGEDTSLTLSVELADGRDAKFPEHPWKRFSGRAWAYTASPVDAEAESAAPVTQQDLLKVAPRQVVVSLYDFDGARLFRKQCPLDLSAGTDGTPTGSLSIYSGSLPVGHYSLTTDFLNADGKVVARGHEHQVAVVWGPVDVSDDAVPRTLSNIGHWLASKNLPASIERLEWLHRVGVTQHQKINQAWSVWGVKHDGKGNVTVGDAPAIDALLRRADELGVELIGDLTFGWVRSDLKRDGQLMALTAGEQEATRRQAQLESDARKVRLVPAGAAPLPRYGDPAFAKTLYDYAFHVVSRYKGRVKRWTGDNEIDLHCGGGHPAVAKVCARASRILYEAMKEADPEAEFITASIVRASPFTEELIRQGFAHYADHVDVHTHPYEAPALSAVTIGNTEVEGFGAIRAHVTNESLSVYYGEVSAPLAHAPNGTVGQAAAIPKQLAWVLKQPQVKMLSYLVLYSSEANLGFCNIHEDPLPANNAINVAAHLLDGRPLLEDLEGLPEGVEHIRVEGADGREVLLLWSHEPTTVALPCAPPNVELVDLIGRRTETRPEGGRLSLTVNPDPQYVVGRKE